jgi:hypothetical protein
MAQESLLELRETVRRKIFEMSIASNEKSKPIYRNLTQLHIAGRIASKCGLKKTTANVQLSAALSSGANYLNVLIEANKYLDKLQESYRAKCESKKGSDK